MVFPNQRFLRYKIRIRLKFGAPGELEPCLNCPWEKSEPKNALEKVC